VHAGLSALVQRDPLFGTFAAATIAALEVPGPSLPNLPADQLQISYPNSMLAFFLLMKNGRNQCQCTRLLTGQPRG